MRSFEVSAPFPRECSQTNGEWGSFGFYADVIPHKAQTMVLFIQPYSYPFSLCVEFLYDFPCEGDTTAVLWDDQPALYERASHDLFVY
jgi:hypothetical protein